MECTVQNVSSSIKNVTSIVWTKQSHSPDSWYIEIENVLYEKVTLAICIFGVLGNILNLAVLSHKSVIGHMDRMEKSAHLGLVALAVSDLFFCISALPHSFENRLRFEYDAVSFELWYKVYGNGIINIFIMSSTWLTVVMAMCRYLAICFPIRGRQILGKTFTSVSISAVFVICVVFNLPRFWFQRIDHVQCQEGWRAFYPSLGVIHGTIFEQAYLWSYCAFCIIIPLILLAYCNVYLIRALRSSRQLRRQHSRLPHDNTASERNHCLTLILTIIVILCVCLVTPAELVNFAKSVVVVSPKFHASDAYNLAIAVCNTLQALNFSVNFVLYCAVNVHFRQSIRVMCGWKAVPASRLHLTNARHYASTSADELDTVALNTLAQDCTRL